MFTDSLRPIYTSQRIEKTLPEPTCVQPSPNELSETIGEGDSTALGQKPVQVHPSSLNVIRVHPSGLVDERARLVDARMRQGE